MRARSISAALLCAAIVVTSCAPGGNPQGSIQAHGEDRFPFSTLSEARTFADYWVEADVVHEMFGKLEGGDPHEGYVPRTVTLAVARAVWRNAAQKQSRVVPMQFDVSVVGHALHDDRSTPLVVEGAAYLRVGQRYLLGLVWDSGELALPSPRAALRIVDGRIVNVAGGHADETIADDVNGLPPEQAVASILKAPLLVADQSLTPDERLSELLRTGEG